MDDSRPAWKTQAADVARKAGGLTLAVVLGALAMLTAIAVLMTILVRDVPSLSSVAQDVVEKLAVAARVPAGNIDAVSAQVVSRVDSSLLGGALSVADSLRLLFKVLYVVPILVILVLWRLAPTGWARRRSMGWTAGIFGLALLLYAWMFSGAAHTALSVLPDQAETVGDRFVAKLFGPTWTIAWLTLLCGAGLYLYARRRLGRP